MSRTCSLQRGGVHPHQGTGDLRAGVRSVLLALAAALLARPGLDRCAATAGGPGTPTGVAAARGIGRRRRPVDVADRGTAAVDAPTRRAERSPGGRRSASARYCGSRSFHHASSGAATKIDEYEPMNRPAASASAKSSSAVAPKITEPTISSDSTGSSATNDVESERISTWFSDRFTISPYVDAPGRGERRAGSP